LALRTPSGEEEEEDRSATDFLLDVCKPAYFCLFYDRISYWSQKELDKIQYSSPNTTHSGMYPSF